MKRILLASASIVAFAGAAAAQETAVQDGITLTGTGTAGYNDEIEDGFYVEGDLGFKLSRTLNNDLVLSVTFGLGFEDNSNDDFSNEDDLDLGSDFVLALTDTAGTSGMYYGDVLYAAETHWESVDLLNTDDFSEQDEETVLRGDFTYGDISASLSYNLADEDGDGADDIDQLSLGASGTVGSFGFAFGYQEESDAFNQVAGEIDPDGDGPLPPIPTEDPDEEDTSSNLIYDNDPDDDFNTDEIFAIGATTTFSGFDLAVGYSKNNTLDDDSLGFGARYALGPVILGAAYVFEFDNPDGTDDSYRIEANYVSGPLDVIVFYESDRGEDDSGIEADFDAGNGFLLRAGYIDSTEGYIGAEYDMGNGARLIATYADQDEEGRPEYKQGTTVALSFSF